MTPHPWHKLLAPLPLDAVVTRKPVASPEILATPEGSAIAGWVSLSVELTAGPHGMRHIMLTLDATGRPISAGDYVLYEADGEPGENAAVTYVHESLGGRLEEDGSFKGTRWHTVMVQQPGADEAEPREQIPSPPTDVEIAGIKALVAEVMKRAPK